MRSPYYMRHPIKISSKFLSIAIAAGIAVPASNTTLPAAFADDSRARQFESTIFPDQNSVNALTKSILSREIELERLNTNFRLETTRQGKYKRWRQFFYTEANACATESGLLSAMCERFSNLRRGKIIFTRVRLKDNTYALRGQLQTRRVKHYRTEHSLEPQMIGQWIATAGAAIELSANMLNSCRLRQRGFDPETCRKRVLQIKKETDELLSRRQSLVNSLPGDDAAAASAEGKILKDIRDLSLLEYEKFHIGAKRSGVMQNTQELFHIYRNAIGATGNLINIVAAHSRRRHMAGTGLLCTMLSGVGIFATPIAARVASAVAGKVAARDLSPHFSDIAVKDPGVFEADRNELEKMLTSTSKTIIPGAEAILPRLSVYKLQSDLFAGHKSLAAREKEQTRLTTIENLTTGALVGSTKIAFGITGMAGSYKNIRNPKAQDRLAAAGNTTYSIGTDVTILEGLRVRIAGERETGKLRRQNMLAGQVLQQGLKTLAEMESKIQ